MTYPVTIQARFNRQLTPEQSRIELENLDNALKKAQGIPLPPGVVAESLPDAALQGGRVDSIDRMPEWATKVILRHGFTLNPVQMTYSLGVPNTALANIKRRTVVSDLNAQWNPRWYHWIKPVMVNIWYKIARKGRVDFDLYRTDWIEDTPGMVERAMQSRHIILDVFDHSVMDENTEKMANQLAPFGKRTLRTVTDKKE